MNERKLITGTGTPSYLCNSFLSIKFFYEKNTISDYRNSSVANGKLDTDGQSEGT
jgi:hypothetical protein